MVLASVSFIILFIKQISASNTEICPPLHFGGLEPLHPQTPLPGLSVTPRAPDRWLALPQGNRHCFSQILVEMLLGVFLAFPFLRPDIELVYSGHVKTPCTATRTQPSPSTELALAGRSGGGAAVLRAVNSSAAWKGSAGTGLRQRTSEVTAARSCYLPIDFPNTVCMKGDSCHPRFRKLFWN